MARYVGWMGLAQVGIVVVAYVVVNLMLDILGYPEAALVRWNPIAVRFYHHGAGLLIVPILWVPYALVCEQIDRGLFSATLAMIFGILFPLLILVAFLNAIATPYARPLLRAAPPLSQSVHPGR
ncbi:hypothetical protein [Schlesneria sp. T3-172]|uniref:hypothetical protein n=1 Tax=Schlesneria sphaerica TaxID=3373610 RepID=UPI0037C51D12